MIDRVTMSYYEDMNSMDLQNMPQGAFTWGTIEDTSGKEYKCIYVVMPYDGGTLHMLPVLLNHPTPIRLSNNKVGWSWDGNKEKPTLSPSIDCRKGRWHGYMRAGVLESV